MLGITVRTCDLIRRAALASRYHDQQLHNGVVDLRTPRLNNKNIFFSYTREDSDTCLALERVSRHRRVRLANHNHQEHELWEAHIGKLCQFRISGSDAKIFTYLSGENRARVASKNQRVAHGVREAHCMVV